MIAALLSEEKRWVHRGSRYRLCPPRGDQAPAHLPKLKLVAVARDQHVDRRGRGDVVAAALGRSCSAFPRCGAFPDHHPPLVVAGWPGGQSFRMSEVAAEVWLGCSRYRATPMSGITQLADWFAASPINLAWPRWPPGHRIFVYLK
jgi:hypothetical protein